MALGFQIVGSEVKMSKHKIPILIKYLQQFIIVLLYTEIGFG